MKIPLHPSLVGTPLQTSAGGEIETLRSRPMDPGAGKFVVTALPDIQSSEKVLDDFTLIANPGRRLLITSLSIDTTKFTETSMRLHTFTH